MADWEETDNTSHKRVINYKLPHLSYCLPHFQVQPRAKANGKGSALKGNRPVQKRKRPPPSIRNTQPNRPYAVTLPSAAPR